MFENRRSRQKKASKNWFPETDSEVILSSVGEGALVFSRRNETLQEAITAGAGNLKALHLRGYPQEPRLFYRSLREAGVLEDLNHAQFFSQTFW